MVSHLNWIHSHSITNGDYLYTLALFIIEPDRWMNSFGYRKLKSSEQYALYREFKDLGEAMNIKDMKASAWILKNWWGV